MRMRNRKQGFTLVEILIVVVILGILAAIVIPQFTNASQSARASALVSQLQTIRSQLELAQVQHEGTYPALETDGWGTMTAKTEPDTAYSTPDGSGNEVGPYLQQAPSNAFAPSGFSTEVVTSGTSGAWLYDQATGEIKAIIDISKDQAESLGLIEDAAAASFDNFVFAP